MSFASYPLATHDPSPALGTLRALRWRALGAWLVAFLAGLAPAAAAEPTKSGTCAGRTSIVFCRQTLGTATTQVTCYERHGLGADVPALDLAPLACLPGLESLSLASGEIEFIERLKLGSLRPLAGLPHLRRLSFEETGLTDLSPLAPLSQLQVLSLHASPVTDLRPLAGLVQLRELDLSCTRVSDLSALRGLSKLQRLDLTRAPVRDLQVLAELTQLSWLGLAADAGISPEARAVLVRRRPGLVISEGRRY